MILGLRFAVLTYTCNHLKGRPSNRVSLHLLELLIVISFKGGYLVNDFDKINDKLFEVLNAHETVSLADFDAFCDELGHGLEITVIILNQTAKFKIVFVAFLRELHG